MKLDNTARRLRNANHQARRHTLQATHLQLQYSHTYDSISSLFSGSSSAVYMPSTMDLQRLINGIRITIPSLVSHFGSLVASWQLE